MTGLSPSALPTAVSSAGPSGVAAASGGVQESGFSSVFSERPARSTLPANLSESPPATVDTPTDIPADGAALPEPATVDDALSGAEFLLGGNPATTLIESLSRQNASIPAPAQHAANLMQMRLDHPQPSATAPGAGPAAVPHPGAGVAALGIPTGAAPNALVPDLPGRIQAADRLDGRDGASGRSEKADATPPVTGAAAAAPVQQGLDVPLGFAESNAPGEGLSSEGGPGGGDPSAPQVVSETRRSGADTVTLHRPASASLPAERQIVAAVSATPTGRTEIVLDPQELGRVRLSLEGDESALVLTIQAERGDTADLLRRNADLLLQEFREAGYENLTFSFSDQGRAAADQTSADDDFATDTPQFAAELVTDIPPRRTALGSLDLRL